MFCDGKGKNRDISFLGKVWLSKPEGRSRDWFALSLASSLLLGEPSYLRAPSLGALNLLFDPDNVQADYRKYKVKQIRIYEPNESLYLGPTIGLSSLGLASGRLLN